MLTINTRSWLFASSLVLGVGLLGGFGRILEKYTRKSITTLEHFAKSDAHAMQYSLIAKSLLNTAIDYVEKREVQERLQRTESSSQLFGLIPHEARRSDASSMQTPAPGHQMTSPFSSANRESGSSGGSNGVAGPGGLEGRRPDGISPFGGLGVESPHMNELDSTLLAFSGSLGPRTPDLFEGSDDFSALNLFPLLDATGHIDLANYL